MEEIARGHHIPTMHQTGRYNAGNNARRGFTPLMAFDTPGTISAGKTAFQLTRPDLTTATNAGIITSRMTRFVTRRGIIRFDSREHLIQIEYILEFDRDRYFSGSGCISTTNIYSTEVYNTQTEKFIFRVDLQQ